MCRIGWQRFRNYSLAMAIIESIPNVSEGRRADVIAELVGAVEGVPGVRLLDHSSDASHNRSVLTLVGDAEPLKTAILALYAAALRHIDLRAHQGEHPRLGAVDVVPFVPIEGVSMPECVALAREVSAAVAERFAVPVYLYEEASSNPTRKNLEDIRRGEFEGLAEKMRSPGWAPDFGPGQPHERAGASVIGARMPLIAYNINLNTDRLDVAKKIASAIRHSSGGLRYVKAMGVMLEDRRIAQVSMNLTNVEKTPIFRVFEMVKREAARQPCASAPWRRTADSLLPRSPDRRAARDVLLGELDATGEAAVGSDSLLLCSIGRHQERKGFHWFVDAVMPSLGGGAVYLLAGSGPMTAAKRPTML